MQNLQLLTADRYMLGQFMNTTNIHAIFVTITVAQGGHKRFS